MAAQDESRRFKDRRRGSRAAEDAGYVSPGRSSQAQTDSHARRRDRLLRQIRSRGRRHPRRPQRSPEPPRAGHPHEARHSRQGEDRAGQCAVQEPRREEAQARGSGQRHLQGGRALHLRDGQGWQPSGGCYRPGWR